jgi:hypothetical protein
VGYWNGSHPVHMCVNGKMWPVETTPELGKEGIKENGRGSEFKYDIFDVLEELL